MVYSRWYKWSHGEGPWVWKFSIHSVGPRGVLWGANRLRWVLTVYGHAEPGKLFKGGDAS